MRLVPPPKFSYKNDYRAIHVNEGDPWHNIHRSHRLKRCDQTLFCVRCGSTSSGNRTKWFQQACNPNGKGCEEKRPKHIKDMIDRALLKGRCPYRGNWKSGLNNRIVWPPCDVGIYEEYILHHTKCDCTDRNLPANPYSLWEQPGCGNRNL